MATKYFCDVCKEETRNLNELQEITRDYKSKCVLTCDLCKACAEKIFKPVKEWHSTFTISVEVTED